MRTYKITANATIIFELEGETADECLDVILENFAHNRPVDPMAEMNVRLRISGECSDDATIKVCIIHDAEVEPAI